MARKRPEEKPPGGHQAAVDKTARAALSLSVRQYIKLAAACQEPLQGTHHEPG